MSRNGLSLRVVLAEPVPPHATNTANRYDACVLCVLLMLVVVVVVVLLLVVVVVLLLLLLVVVVVVVVVVVRSWCDRFAGRWFG